MDNIGALIVPAAIVLFAISIVARGLRIVRQAHTIIIERLPQTTLRKVMGEREVAHVLSSRATINAKLREIVEEATHKWGAKVSGVELKDINPPRDIRDGMEKQMGAERDRGAAILTAEA